MALEQFSTLSELANAIQKVIAAILPMCKVVDVLVTEAIDDGATIDELAVILGVTYGDAARIHNGSTSFSDVLNGSG